MIIKLMIVEMVIIFLMISHHHSINDAMIIKLMIVEEGLNPIPYGGGQYCPPTDIFKNLIKSMRAEDPRFSDF